MKGSAILGDALLLCAAGTFCMAILDLLLSEQQKMAITEYLTRTWYRLDEVKQQVFSKRYWISTLLVLAIVATVFIFFSVAIDIVESILFGKLTNAILAYLGVSYRFPMATDPELWPIQWIGLAIFLGFVALVTIVPALSLSICMMAIATVELIVRRTAENSKGPIIAFGALLAAAAALFKAMA
jgi:hypothetical protein